LDRFAYVYYNPLKYTDPSGHIGVVTTDPLIRGASNTFLGGQFEAKVRAQMFALYYKQTEETRKSRIYWDGLSEGEQTILHEGGWDKGAYNDFISDDTRRAKLLEDPAFYFSILVSGGFKYIPKFVNLICLDGNCFNEIQTDYGRAYQDLTKEALEARSEVQSGATLYKIGTFGPSDVLKSQYWALENPFTDPNYVSKYGIPPENLTGGESFLIIGHIREGFDFITRVAPGVGSYVGGAIEVVVQECGVKIIAFIMP
jgi:hypothetical protein